MSTYGNYIKEREGKEIIEDSLGFATYQFLDDNRCYIENIYVIPDHRNSNVASSYADKITEIAKERGCTKLIGSVCPTTSGATASLKVLLAYGFSLDSCLNNIIIFSKDIK
jgi:ribosomal protein S18 acetylase RimI-like enzyme